MATPGFTVQNMAVVLSQHAPTEVFFKTFDLNGNPVDISAGYTIKNFRAASSLNYNPRNPGFDLHAIGTYTFTTTGLKWVLAAADLNSIFSGMDATGNGYVLTLSNDAGVTESTIAASSMTLNNTVPTF